MRLLKRLFKVQINIIRIVILDGKLIKKRYRRQYQNKVLKRLLKDGTKYKVMDINK